MSRYNRTKDENYLISLYEEAQKSGDPENSIDRYHAGRAAHISEKAVDAICKLLVQANFIKKSGEDEVYLTPHGIKLVQKLLLE